jgi:hypothetical protein
MRSVVGLSTTRKVLAAALLVLVLVTVVVVVARSPEEESQEAGLALGFNNNAVTQGYASPAEAAELLERVGATTDRVQIDWATLEPQPGEYNFATYDAIYAEDLAHGITPLFVFAYAPVWANGGVCDPSHATCLNPPTPAFYDEAAQTAAVIAERYPDVAGIEIWNEPNTPYFWPPAADPSAYAQLLIATYDAVKRVAPDTVVAGASTSNSPVFGPGYVADDEFVKAIFDAGAGDAMDALAVHVYPEPGDLTGASAASSLKELLATIRELDPDPPPVWVSETGISRSGNAPISEAEQATATVRLVERLANVEGVEMVLVHTLIQARRAPGDPESGFGLVREDLSPLAGYCELGELWSGTPVC